jgi:hypothetical protein
MSDRLTAKILESLTSRVVAVTPEMARHLRDTCHFERQRPISATNIKRLAREMTKGRFIPGTPIFFCVLPDGGMAIVNGNHTLEAVVTSGMTQVLTFVLLRVASLKEAGDVYASFDMHKARTWLDALKAVGLEDAVEMPNQVMSAVGIIMQGFRYNAANVEAHRSRPARFETMLDYKSEAAIIHQALSGAPATHRRLVLRAAVLSVALETVRYQATMAVDFWRPLALDDGLTTGDPRKTLLRYLQNTKAGGGPTQAQHMSKATSQAWNAWFEGRSLQVCRPTVGSVFVLAGTPWGTKDWTGYGSPLTDSRAGNDRPQEEGGGQTELPNLDDLLSTGLRSGPRGPEPVTFFKPCPTAVRDANSERG